MREALPYKTWLPISQQPFLPQPSPPNTILTTTKPPQRDQIMDMVSENAVIVLGRRGCCMSHVVKRLLQGLGANPAVHEFKEDDETRVVNELETMTKASDGQDHQIQFPAVFIGGELFGGLDRIMATHITGELIPILKKAGALWL